LKIQKQDTHFISEIEPSVTRGNQADNTTDFPQFGPLSWLSPTYDTIWGFNMDWKAECGGQINLAHVARNKKMHKKKKLKQPTPVPL